MLTLALGMQPRHLLFITLLALCHLQIRGQALTNAAPPPSSQPVSKPDQQPVSPDTALPDDPGQELLPTAQPEPEPSSGVPVQWEAQHQSRVGDTWTLDGGVVVHYRDYILRSDKVVYHQSTTELEADGNLQVTGGPNDVHIYASRGEMRLNMHTARFFNVHGSQGVRALGRTAVYSTTNPFLFSGRVLLQTGEGHYRIVDGAMTNCRLPHPDWQLYSRDISLDSGLASTSNVLFKFLGVPIFYLPYLRHPIEETGRESGFLIPVVSTGSSIRGYTFGEQVYWVIGRNMDMVAGAEYYSKRGWAPNGDFRYKGPGMDHLTVRWNALLDRGVEETVPATATQTAGAVRINQGGEDISAVGRMDLDSETRLAGNADYLSSYLYRLVFNDNYWLAISSEVASNVSLTHTHNGYISSVSTERFQSFAGTVNSNQNAINGNQARILHLPTLRFDVLDRPLSASGLYWGLGTSLGYMGRSEPGEPISLGGPAGTAFHARNAGRIDFSPHLSLPLVGSGWSLVPEVALRETVYSISQNPDLLNKNGGVPTISHDSLLRSDIEASVDLRPPAIEREYNFSHWNRELRHVIEPEFTYRYVTGIGAQARSVLLIDTTDIATDTNEVGYSLTQRLFLKPISDRPCSLPGSDSQPKVCPPQGREWASWQIAQKLYIDPNFGGALLAGRRNVFDSTLDLSAIAFLTGARNLSPVTSRVRFEAIDNLRIQWDLDYDPKAGRMSADNVFAGYSWGRTTVGVGHALLNAVDESQNAAAIIKSQQMEPFLSIGKPSGKGFNLAANGGYDFTHSELQYAGAQAVYNWDCCGLTIGYRRFSLGSVRDETQYLWSFTLANFGSVGDVRRSNSAFRDPTLPPAY
jgi:LPS-assembly protein